MELIIRDSSKIVGVDFGEWLLPHIKIKLLSNITKYKFNNIDKYLTESSDLKQLYKRDYFAKDIIIFASNNLVCTGVDGEIFIRYNNTKFTPGFDRLKLQSAIKLLNYGNLDIKGCPIFTDTFKYFEENILTFVDMYYKL